MQPSQERLDLCFELEEAKEHVRQIDTQIEHLLQDRHHEMDRQYHIRTAIAELATKEGLKGEHAGELWPKE